MQINPTYAFYGEEMDESFKVQCTKCGKTKDYEAYADDVYEDYSPCSFCENITCIECEKKGYYLIPVTRAGLDHGICSFCFKSDEITCRKSAVYYSDWKKLHIKYKKLKEEKNTYIKQLEEEIKLLKAMVDFQPGGEGYLATRDHFKQLQNNDKN
jgi:hypothetical protein